MFYDLFLADTHDVVRRRLVDKVIEPVGKQKIGMAAPTDNGLLRVIVIGEVVLGNLNRKAEILITDIFSSQRIRVILRVTHNENLAVVIRFDSINARFVPRAEQSGRFFSLNLPIIETVGITEVDGVDKPDPIVVDGILPNGKVL